MIWLRVLPLRGEPFTYRFDGDSLVIGRASDAELTLEDDSVSRQHARLYRRDGGWMLEDLGSYNGTLVADRKIDGPTAVGPGDVLSVSGWGIELHSAAPVFRNASDLVSTVNVEVDGLEDLRTLKRHARQLKVLNGVHQALARPLALKELLELILECVFRLLEPDEGAIFLRGSDGEYRSEASRSRSGLRGGYLYSTSLVREVAEKGVAALVLDARADERFSGAVSMISSGVRSLVAAPLLDAEGSLGMIALNCRGEVRQFTEEDMALLASVASVAALRIRNATLVEQAVEHRRLEEELAMARKIQVALLPKRLPQLPGYDVHAGNVPSRGVSGDYYAVVDRQEGHERVIMLADVAGKGMAASLLTSCLEALSAGPIRDGLPPAEICGRISPLLHERTSGEKFATALLAVLEPETGTVRYANAGHNPGLLLRRSGEVVQLRPTGPPLGLWPEAEYTSGKAALEAGDTLVFYTDGIIEAEDPEEQEYGVSRLIEVCLRQPEKSLSELAEAAEADLEEFTRGVPFADDRTLVLVRRWRE